jgi:ribonucleoside-diphosphate reductase alpha chain
VIARHLGGAAAPAIEAAAGHSGPAPAVCPSCGAAALIRKEGCDTCQACGHSKCG